MMSFRRPLAKPARSGRLDDRMSDCLVHDRSAAPKGVTLHAALSDDGGYEAALKRRTTFSRRRETGPSKPLRHRLPQKVIEPTENTAPPEGNSQ